MALSFDLVKKLFIGSFIVGIATYWSTASAMSAVQATIGISAIVAILWGLSAREETFAHLSLNKAGVLNAVGFVASVVALAQTCVIAWGYPTTGSYIFSLFTVISLWWTAYAMEPGNN